MGIITSMAPLKKQMRGWLRLFQILPANYGFHFESEPRFISQKTDYAGVSEAAGLESLRSVTKRAYLKTTYCS